LAISEYREVLRIDPDNVLAHSNLAKIYVLQGKFDLAKQESEEVSRIDPSLTDVRNSPAMSQQSHPSTKKTMPMLPRVMLSVLAVFLVGGPVAALMGTHNAFVGIIAGAIAFLLLPSLFGSSD
jgi:tetratricopeptide (TPR) repeat protein